MLAGTAATFVSTGRPLGRTAALSAARRPGRLDLAARRRAQHLRRCPGGATCTLYRFHVDFVTPANSTFTLLRQPGPRPAYTTLCAAHAPACRNLGRQPALDGIGDRLMFRLAYRRFADGHEALVGNNTVSSGGVAGVRWFEITQRHRRRAVTFVQQSTYQPDTTWRWMGSAAMDQQGDMALGFSASSSTINPAAPLRGPARDRPGQTRWPGRSHALRGHGLADAAPAIAGATTAT